MTVILENNALTRTAPWPFSIPSSGMISGSIGGKSNSGIPFNKYGCRWFNVFWKHTSILGSDLLQGNMYSGISKSGSFNAAFLLCSLSQDTGDSPIQNSPKITAQIVILRCGSMLEGFDLGRGPPMGIKNDVGQSKSLGSCNFLNFFQIRSFR